MYIYYKRIDSIKQLKEIEKEGRFNLMKTTGHVYNFFIGMYFKCDVVIKLPKGLRKREKDVETFGFEKEGKFMLFFTKIYVIGNEGYKKDNIKRYDTIKYKSPTPHK